MEAKGDAIVQCLTANDICAKPATARSFGYSRAMCSDWVVAAAPGTGAAGIESTRPSESHGSRGDSGHVRLGWSNSGSGATAAHEQSEEEGGLAWGCMATGHTTATPSRTYL